MCNLYIPRPMYVSADISTEMSVGISTDTRPINVDRDRSVEISTEISAECRSTYGPTIGRYLGRCSGRHSADTLTIDCQRNIGRLLYNISQKLRLQVSDV